MIAQLELPTAQPSEEREKTIQSRFEKFHEKNPRVYAQLVKLARELKKQGHDNLGIGMLWEVLRWHYMKEVGPVDTDEGFTLNNIFRSRYARLIEQQESDLKGVFETRKIVTP